MTGLDGCQLVPVSEGNRKQVYRALGLEQFGFLYQERSSSQVLREWKVQGGVVEVQSPLGTSKEGQSLPLLVRKHPGGLLAERPVMGPGEIWDLLMPFPFSYWGVQASAEAGGGVESSSSDWLRSIQKLREAFKGLEAVLHRAEVSLLSFDLSGPEPLTLFFHCVRKRFLSQGVLNGLDLSRAPEQFSKTAASFQHLELLVPERADTLSEQVGWIGRSVDALGTVRMTKSHLTGTTTVSDTAPVVFCADS